MPTDIFKLTFVLVVLSLRIRSCSCKILKLSMHHYEVFEVREKRETYFHRDQFHPDFEYTEHEHDVLAGTHTITTADDDEKDDNTSATTSRHLNRERRSRDYYDKDASFRERYFLHTLMAISITMLTALLGLIYFCCCGRGLCPCCKCFIDSAMNDYMIGADVDSKGNIHYRELTDEEREVAAAIRAEYEP